MLLFEEVFDRETGEWLGEEALHAAPKREPRAVLGTPAWNRAASTRRCGCATPPRGSGSGPLALAQHLAVEGDLVDDPVEVGRAVVVAPADHQRVGALRARAAEPARGHRSH